MRPSFESHVFLIEPSQDAKVATVREAYFIHPEIQMRLQHVELW